MDVINICFNLALIIMIINLTRRSKVQEQFDTFNRRMLEELIKDDRLPESLKKQVKLALELNVALYLDNFDKTTKRFPWSLSPDSMIFNLIDWVKSKKEKKA